jgi:hypothetical protein
LHASKESWRKYWTGIDQDKRFNKISFTAEAVRKRAIRSNTAFLRSSLESYGKRVIVNRVSGVESTRAKNKLWEIVMVPKEIEILKRNCFEGPREVYFEFGSQLKEISAWAFVDVVGLRVIRFIRFPSNLEKTGISCLGRPMSFDYPYGYFFNIAPMSNFARFR